jgi:phosphoglucosamine mutase
MSERIFGTDGIRGRAGSGWLTPAGAQQIGAAVGRVLAPTTEIRARRALLGHDGRASGPELAAAVAHGLRAANFETLSAGLLPTPGIAWLARERAFDAAVMISASHNPADDNGIKVFGARGEKLSDPQELAIEAELQRHASTGRAPSAPDAGALHEDAALARAYEDRLCAYGADCDLRGYAIAFDGANGAGSRVGPRVLERLGARVHALACAPDGRNINAACGAVHPERLQALALAEHASIGIALDGDGDRCILVDERGATVDGDAILTVVARHAAQRSELRPARIAATVMSNRGLHRALREVGVSVVDTDVGDRKVVEAMRRESLMLGGEQSGHIVFGAANHWIGDGLYTALAVLRVLRASGRPLSELAAPYRTFPQLLRNVKVRAKPPLLELPGLAAALEEVERALAPDGRVLLRYSGTESLARVMVEGPDEHAIRAHVERLCELVRAAIGA